MVAESQNTGRGNSTDIQVLETFRDRSVYIETYGCRYNFGDTAKLIEILKNKGSILVDSAEAADAVIINTCTVVGPTERRMLRRLSRFRDYDLYVTGSCRKCSAMQFLRFVLQLFSFLKQSMKNTGVSELLLVGEWRLCR